MSLSSIPASLRRKILRRDNEQCQYCRLRQVGQAAVFHINHVVPKSRGGPTHESNLVVQCPHCSLHKSDKLLVSDSTSGDLVRLFHPLQQKWEDHFALDPSGLCKGLTPTGRATVEALHMNHPRTRLARFMQIELRLLEITGG